MAVYAAREGPSSGKEVAMRKLVDTTPLSLGVVALTYQPDRGQPDGGRELVPGYGAGAEKPRCVGHMASY